MTPNALAGVLVLTLVSSGVAADPTDLPEIKGRGTLRILVVDGAPNFFSLKPDGAPGLDREILEGFARLHRVELRPVPVSSWTGLIQALLEKKGDIVAGDVTATEGRRRLADFTAEVFPTRLVVITRKPHPPVESLEQLRGEKVGTVKGTSMIEALVAAKVPASNLDDSFASGSLPAALRTGRVTACVVGVEDAILARKSDPEIDLGLFLGPRQSLAFAVRKGEPHLLAALNDYLDGFRKTGAWSRLVVKYFGEAALEILRKAQDPR